MKLPRLYLALLVAALGGGCASPKLELPPLSIRSEVSVHDTISGKDWSISDYATVALVRSALAGISSKNGQVVTATAAASRQFIVFDSHDGKPIRIDIWPDEISDSHAFWRMDQKSSEALFQLLGLKKERANQPLQRNAHMSPRFRTARLRSTRPCHSEESACPLGARG